MQKFIRARNVRLLVGAALVAIGLWAFLPYITHTVASSAFVNAEIRRITAPIAGRLTAHLPRKGEFIDRDISLPLVDALVPDRRQLAVFQTEQAVATARIELAEKQLKELQVTDQALVERLEVHWKAVLEKLAYQIIEAGAEVRSCTSKATETRQLLAMSQKLAKAGLDSQQNLISAQGAHTTTVADCAAATARRSQLEARLEAARHKIYLEDGFNDTPYSQQQRDRILLRRQTLEAEIARERARLLELRAEIRNEHSRLEKISHFQLLLPAGHVVWAVVASPGSTVVEGQTIIDLANCNRRFVTVELPERKIESVRPGDIANVRFLGSDNWIEGIVRQARGSAARQGGRLLASQIPKPEARHVTVEVALSSQSSSSNVSRYCDIGRLADVRFQKKAIWMVGQNLQELFAQGRRFALGKTARADQDVAYLNGVKILSDARGVTQASALSQR